MRAALWVSAVLLAAQIPAAAAEPSAPPKLLIVAVDGLSWNLVDRLAGEGRLPNLAALIKGGARARLQTAPARRPNESNSAKLWTSIATGVKPERHGILGFLRGEEYTPENLYTSADRKTKAFWNILSDAGRSPTIVGWWVTWPAERVKGRIAAYELWPTRRRRAKSCLACPAGSAADIRPPRRATYPEGLAAELKPLLVHEADLVDNAMDAVYNGTEDAPGLEFWSYARDLSFYRVARRLLSSGRWDVAGVYFESIDINSHAWWRDQENERFVDSGHPPGVPNRATQRLKRYYEWMDGLIGGLVKDAGPSASVMILSDHGFETYEDLRALEFKLDRRIPDMSDEERARLDIDARDAYGHSQEAFFALRSPGVVPGIELSSATIYDVTPTILYLQGLPYGADMDGRPLLAAFAPAHVAAHPAASVSSYGPPTHAPITEADRRPVEDVDGLIRKLKAAGYLHEEAPPAK